MLRLARFARPIAAGAGFFAAGVTTVSALAAPTQAEGSEPMITINYFNIQGPAEPSRLALVLGGIPFEDKRHTRADFQQKKDAGSLPYGQLPTMDVGPKTIAQSVC